MSLAERITRINKWSEPLQWLAEPLALLSRLYVSWVFLKSGWLKVSDWETTTFLFHEEYRMPLFASKKAGVCGAAGELFFPVLRVLGLFGRFSALGLQLVNLLAVVSYAHVLFKEGFEA